MSFIHLFYGDSQELGGDTLQPTASYRAAQLILGPCFVGWLIGIFIAGILSCLFFSYLTGPLYGQDSVSLRTFAWLVWLIALASAVDSAVEAYSYGVAQTRDYITLRTYNIPDCLAAIPQGIGALIVQLYLARRSTSLVEKKSHRIFIRAILYALVLQSWIFSVIQVLLTFFQRNGKPHIMSAMTLNLATAMWLLSNALADIGITSVIWSILHSRLSHCQNHEHLTDIVLQKLMRLSLYSACVTSFVSVGGAICASLAISPQSPFLNLNLAFTALLPGLYGIVFIVTLMIRETLRSDIEGGPSAHPNVVTTMCPCPPSSNSIDNPPQQSFEIDLSSPWPESTPTSPSPELPTNQSISLKSDAFRADPSCEEKYVRAPRRFQRLGSLF